MIFKTYKDSQITASNLSTKWSKCTPLSCFTVICYKTSYGKKTAIYQYLCHYIICKLTNDVAVYSILIHSRLHSYYDGL